MALSDQTAGTGIKKPLYAYNAGVLFRPRIRRILELAGWSVRTGLPSSQEHVAIWGDRPSAGRARWIARQRGASIVTLEDALLRSLRPGRAGDPTFGLLLDQRGIHFDPSRPSDLEILLSDIDTVDEARDLRARNAIDAIKAAHLSKYSATDPDLTLPEPGYVLIIDQLRDDASVRASGGGSARFQEMLNAARAEHSGRQIVIKSHPETALGLRPGYFSEADCEKGDVLISDPVSPWSLLEKAHAVYCHSSTLGLEAILDGHHPRLFGQPFYAGWGLSDDETSPPRRGRKLSIEALFSAAMISYPVWYDTYRDRRGEIEDVIGALGAMTRAWREDRGGYVAAGMSYWKRPHLRRFYGQYGTLKFADPPDRALAKAKTQSLRLMVWAGKAKETQESDIIRVEDGFLRSRGLGAKLIPPLSLVRDDQGIYYDPTQPSRLKEEIARATKLTQAQRRRAQDLIDRINALGLSKYNTGNQTTARLSHGEKILVVGQVEDDASILKGCSEISTNAALLAAARDANPDGQILYKPHPDVLAGLRKGALSVQETALADQVLENVDPATCLGQADQLWTMTSTMGFEALLRGIPVTCLGMPFYAGWGLTTDHMAPPPRRQARPDLVGLVHACLIAYPRYHDPVTNLPCPVETVLERLSDPALPRPTGNRILGMLQSFRARRQKDPAP